MVSRAILQIFFPTYSHSTRQISADDAVAWGLYLTVYSHMHGVEATLSASPLYDFHLPPQRVLCCCTQSMPACPRVCVFFFLLHVFVCLPLFPFLLTRLLVCGDVSQFDAALSSNWCIQGLLSWPVGAPPSSSSTHPVLYSCVAVSNCGRSSHPDAALVPPEIPPPLTLPPKKKKRPIGSHRSNFTLLLTDLVRQIQLACVILLWFVSVSIPSLLTWLVSRYTAHWTKAYTYNERLCCFLFVSFTSRSVFFSFFFFWLCPSRLLLVARPNWVTCEL